MANRSREIHLDRFRTNDEYKIMIASIKTGGLGLDFSVANKCILVDLLVDLWWNEAVQDQVGGRA
jgi:SNF2 family DNA or RNA helicase